MCLQLLNEDLMLILMFGYFQYVIRVVVSNQCFNVFHCRFFSYGYFDNAPVRYQIQQLFGANHGDGAFFEGQINSGVVMFHFFLILWLKKFRGGCRMKL